MRIVFRESRVGKAVTVERDGGQALLDVCDDARAPVEFSCRSASCGTCRIDVIEGDALLDPAKEDEIELLRTLGASPRQRLACQVQLREGRGLLELGWVDD